MFSRLGRSITAIAFCIGLFAPGIASACLYPPPPPPLPGEREADHKARSEKALEEYFKASWLKGQRDAWEEADKVLFARIEKVRRIAVDGSPWGHRVTLQPISWLKGELYRRRFELRDTALTSCGFVRGGDATSGKIGEIFLIYLGRGRPRTKSLIRSYSIEHVEDPAIKSGMPWKPPN